MRRAESRQGRQSLAQRGSGGCESIRKAPGRGGTNLIDQISRIVFNAMPPQNGTKFLLEGEFAVVIFLVSNIASHRVDV